MLNQVKKIDYRIIKELGIIGSNEAETTELNLISYNNYKPKLDLRKWKKQEDGTKRLDRGLTLTTEEAIKLRDILEVFLSDTKDEIEQKV